MNYLVIGLFCLFPFLIGCQSGGTYPNSNISINPPKWTHGTWLLKDSPIKYGFRFTADNMYIIQQGIETNQKQQVAFYDYGIHKITLEETSSDTYYKAVYQHPAGQAVTWEFTKLSENTLKYHTYSASVFVKQ